MQVFYQLTGDLTAPLTKDILVKAHGHDCYLYDKIDTGKTGEVSLQQWNDYLQEQFDEKEVKHPGKGFKWANDILLSIKQGSGGVGEVHQWTHSHMITHAACEL